MNSSQGFLNDSNMSHLTPKQHIHDYYNNHSPEYLAHGPSHGYSQVPLQSDSGAVHASLPDKTALFVANYLHQLRVIHGMDMTLDQAIGICGGQLDIPVANPNPMHDQYFADTDVPSTSHADSQFSKSDTHEVTLSGKVPFISNAVMKTARPLIKHEIFRDGSRAKVRCLEGRCNGRELMKENYARHVRELHLGEKRRAGGHIRRGVRLKFGWLS